MYRTGRKWLKKARFENKCEEGSVGEVSYPAKIGDAADTRLEESDPCHTPLLKTQPAARRVRCEQVRKVSTEVRTLVSAAAPSRGQIRNNLFRRSTTSHHLCTIFTK